MTHITGWLIISGAFTSHFQPPCSSAPLQAKSEAYIPRHECYELWGHARLRVHLLKFVLIVFRDELRGPNGEVLASGETRY